MNDENVLLEAVNICKDYLPSSHQKFRALNNVNLKIYKNEIVYITGESGAGKSTLLNILSGLCEPTSGQILLNNEILPVKNDKKITYIRQKKFGFIFQFYNLLPEFTVLENITMPAILLGEQNFSEIKSKANALIDKLGISKKVQNFPIELSGGEKQRVAIGRALINEPEILFADEPTGNLDAENKNNIYKILDEIWANKKSTIVLVSHDKNINLTNFRTVKISTGKLEE